MTAKKLPPEVDKELLEELERGTRAVIGLVSRWPNYRREIAIELLGAAAGTAESFGVDATATVARIVAQCGKPAELIPPKGS
jgi:hypothetical protein